MKFGKIDFYLAAIVLGKLLRSVNMKDGKAIERTQLSLNFLSMIFMGDDFRQMYFIQYFSALFYASMVAPKKSKKEKNPNTEMT